MSKEDIVIYELIQNSEKKKSFFSNLMGAEGQVFIRASGGKKLSLMVREANENGSLKGILGPGENGKLKSGEAVTVWFYLKSDTFYFECKPKLKGSEVLLNAAGDLFRLQKRTEFRYEIPKNYQATFEIQERDGKKMSLVLNLADLNSKGLGLMGKASDQFSSGEKIRGLLRLGSHGQVNLAGQIRHIQAKGDQLHLGVEIVHSRTTQSEVDLLNLLLLLRRDVFQLSKTHTR